VREAEAAHASAPKEEKEFHLARLREARDTARDTLGENWPKAPNALSGKLKRASPALRNAGVRIEWPTRHDNKGKVIKVTLAQSKSNGQTSSGSSDRPAQPGNSADSGDFHSKSADDPPASPVDPSAFPDGLYSDDLAEGRTTAERSSSEISSGGNRLSSKDNLPAENGGNGPDDISRPISDGDDDDDENNPPKRVQI
jgi:hypothetical protein